MRLTVDQEADALHLRLVDVPVTDQPDGFPISDQFKDVGLD